MSKKKTTTTKTVRYTGTSDFYELAPEDFAKAEVETEALMSFPRGVDVPVSDDVAQALLNDNPDEGIFHDFPFEAGEDMTSEEAEEAQEELDSAQSGAPGNSSITATGTGQGSIASTPATSGNPGTAASPRA